MGSLHIDAFSRAVTFFFLDKKESNQRKNQDFIPVTPTRSLRSLKQGFPT